MQRYAIKSHANVDIFRYSGANMLLALKICPFMVYGLKLLTNSADSACWSSLIGSILFIQASLSKYF